MGAKTAIVNPSVFGIPQAGAPPLWITSACIVAVDSLALAAVYWLAVLGRYEFSRWSDTAFNTSSYVGLFPLTGLFVAAFFAQGLYPGLLLHPAEEMRRVFYCITCVLLLIGSTGFLWRSAEAYSRSVFLFTWAAGVPAVLLARNWARSVLAKQSWWGVPAVVLGTGPSARRVARCLSDLRFGIRVKGLLTEDAPLTWERDLPPLLGGLASAPAIAEAKIANYAIVTLPERSPLQVRQAVHDHCAGFRHILLVPDFAGLCSLGVTARELGGEVGLEVPQRLFHPSAAVAKRVLDLGLSAAAMVALAPLLVAVAAAIKMTSRGPVLFAHTRCGRKGKAFKAYKFRTMVADADKVLAKHLEDHPEHIVEWLRDHKLKADPRVTPVGMWLRRYSLDELPQLLNVLRGEMSLVGPRPIVTMEIPKYGSGYRLYVRVIPGITGLWQVSGRNNTTYEERVAFDEYYVRNWSGWLDAYILARTLKAVFSAEGAY